MEDEENFNFFLGKCAATLICAHYEKDDETFVNECRELAKRLDEMGESQVASFIRAQIGDEPSWVPM